ncbi:LptF/LptG family permease [Anaeromyxobacter oryzisoli]|uniref:LptF/LptG family permease n=1 Tax=Anaeromyxobacter oryzisoli TaxID=2925408 RepID=UPI001F561199|nr:LptF/LptG family permease [Anaeromyxobacter sp. SG63]
MILLRYVAWRTLGAFLGALVGVVGIFLAVDFVDNAASFTGPGWFPAVLELYANKAAGVVYLVAPAAMLLGASIATSTFRQTREYTAMRAVGLGPWRIAVPILAVAILSGVALVVLNDVVGVRAADRAEEITAKRFGRGGDLRRYLAAREPKRWFRGQDGRHVYHLRGNLPGGGFERATILELSPEFTVARRIDAARMRPEGDAWVLEDVQDRRFELDGRMTLEQAPARRYRFDEPPESFSVVPGRPAQMRWLTLLRQIAIRRHLGLPVVEFELERYGRLAYPFAAVPGVLLAVALALRANRKGHVAVALVEAVGVSLVFWSLQGVGEALGMSGRLTPWLAQWGPNLLLLVVGVVVVRRAR